MWFNFKYIAVLTGRFCAVAVLFSASVLLFCGDSSNKGATFDSENEAHQSGYVIGRSIGTDLVDMIDSTELDVVFMAIREVFDEQPVRLSDSMMAAVDVRTKREITERRNQRQMERQRQQMEEHRRLAESNLASSRAFLEANGRNAGVVTTASGLQYIVINEGSGPKPSASDRVSVNYKGTLPDGTVFDERREPVTFALGGMISGWIEALQLMSVGSKYRIFVPPELAYRDRSVGSIGPNMVLIFEVELLGIER